MNGLVPRAPFDLFHVDAFTEKPFFGNPAGVCLLDRARTESWMQSAAAEMNLSETAFLLPVETGYSLRWFTPKKEVSLCGHATLASAHILWEEGRLAAGDPAVFATQSGLLTARKDGDWIEMDFPARSADLDGDNPAVFQAAGVKPACARKAILPAGEYYLLELGSAEAVRGAAPDFETLVRLGVRAVLITARSGDPAYDFISRYFAPSMGVPEDPVTGSAHCYLAPYWGRKLGKTVLTGFQVSRRTGVVACRWEGERVFLRGRAVTISRSRLAAQSQATS